MEEDTTDSYSGGSDTGSDSDNGGTAISLNDVDGDRIPDYIDTDSDGDGSPDLLEGFDDDGDRQTS